MVIKFDVHRQHDFSFHVFVVAMGNLKRPDRVTIFYAILYVSTLSYSELLTYSLDTLRALQACCLWE